MIHSYQLLEVSDYPDNPKDMKPGILYMERCYHADPASEPMACSFLCPCGCGHGYNVPLQGWKSASPQWTLAGTVEKPSLIPSVVHTQGCMSHFYLTDGIINWC